MEKRKDKKDITGITPENVLVNSDNMVGAFSSK